MQLRCGSCQHQFLIDDAKVPQGPFKVRCPKCTKIVSAQKNESGAGEAEPEIGTAIQSFVAKEITRLKKEILESIGQQSGKISIPSSSSSAQALLKGTNKALICGSDQIYVDSISGTLDRMGYSSDIAQTIADAIKRIDANSYSLVTVDSNLSGEQEDWRKAVDRLNSQKSLNRRHTFVILIAENVKSADSAAAFFNGVNMIVNRGELGNLKNFITDGQKYFQQFYDLFTRVSEERNL
ncbi:MAG TPA: zinc-ribbon domain-containing protein [Acidobacteriota bacterium]|nr:zinc-ribbon domain-containing protein [Acidobacteriota bacterium]